MLTPQVEEQQRSSSHHVASLLPPSASIDDFDLPPVVDPQTSRRHEPSTERRKML